MDADLARRLAEHSHFPSWRLERHGAPVVVQDGITCYRTEDGIRVVDVAPNPAPDPEWLPDLDDPATAGVLLDLHGLAPTREGDTMVCRTRDGELWSVGTHCGATLGEAVARALLAVWDRG